MLHRRHVPIRSYTFVHKTDHGKIEIVYASTLESAREKLNVPDKHMWKQQIKEELEIK